LLLEHKADVDAKTNYGWTALYATAGEGHEVVVRLLLEHKADADTKNHCGWAVLALASRLRAQ
jgi:ankyrin repeat protein